MIEKELFDQLCSEVFPLAKRFLASEPYAITLSGSHGKGTFDSFSDFDFRLYYEKLVGQEASSDLYRELFDLMRRWRERGVEVDGIWLRDIAEIEAQLQSWLSGNGAPIPLEWSVWGYNVLTDVYNQQILEDPFGIAARWKNLLAGYPAEIGKCILDRHGSSLRYWCNDYHYANKVRRKDFVFLASLAARLVNDIMQVVFALNRVYYPGDGNNLTFTRNFTIKPHDFEERVVGILYPEDTAERLQIQYDSLMKLVDEVLALGPRPISTR
jgi:hypothetical protein